DLLAPLGALLGRHVDPGALHGAARQLTLEDGEPHPAHRVAPAGGIERVWRRELDIAGVGCARLGAPALAGAALHDALGVGHALRAAVLALHADQRGAGIAELLQRDFAHAQPARGAAQLVEMGGALLGAHLDGDAALDIDAEIDAD